MKSEYEITQMSFSRNENGEGEMDVDMTLKGDGTKQESLLSILDGVMEGLSATVLHEFKVEKADEMEIDSFRKGWEVLATVLNAYSLIFAEIKSEYAEQMQEDGEESLNELDLLTAMATVPTLNYKGIRLWTDEETTFSFKNQIDFGYHSLTLNGSVNSIRESLIYTLFFLLVDRFEIEKEKLSSLIDEMIVIEIKRTKKHLGDVEYFNQYTQPWLKELKKLAEA